LDYINIANENIPLKPTSQPLITSFLPSLNLNPFPVVVESNILPLARRPV